MDKIAELAAFHDMGKIVDWAAVGLQACDSTGRPVEDEPHDFEKCKTDDWGIDFGVPVWEAIFRKDGDVRAKKYSGSRAWLLASLADQLAAGLGRGPGEEQFQGAPLYARHSLWKGQPSGDPRLKRVEELRELIGFINSGPTWEQAVERYGTLLRSRAETARPGLNVTTLYAHCVATAKLASVLESALPTLAPAVTSFESAFERIRNSKLVVALLVIDFPQQPFRTRDLHVVEERRRKIAELTSVYDGNVLALFGESLLLIFPSASNLDCLCKTVADSGFDFTLRKGDWPVTYLLSSGIDKALDQDPASLSRALPDEIPPPICQVCEMAAGRLRWPVDHLLSRGDLQSETLSLLQSLPLDEIDRALIPETDRQKLGEWIEEWSEEYLCERCFSLRRGASPSTKLKEWREGTVAWVHVDLSFKELSKCLEKLQTEHARQALGGSFPASPTLPVRIPVLVDFMADFNSFLQAWHGQVISNFGTESVEQIDENLLCVKLTERREALSLLSIHSRLMDEFFPRLVDIDGEAIRVAVSVSSPKYPFFAHWRFLKNPASPVCVQVAEVGQATIPMKCLQQILKVVEHGSRRAFHRLRKVAETSRKLAELVLHDKEDQDDKVYEHLRAIMPLGIDFESLTTLANLVDQ